MAIDVESTTGPVGGPAAPSRAAEVLDELVRGRAGTPGAGDPGRRGRGRRRSWQLRQLAPGAPQRSDAPGADDVVPAPGDVGAVLTGRGGEWIQRSDLRRWASALGVAVVVLAVAAAVFMRRPPPIEEQLPMADAGADASAASPPNSTAEPAAGAVGTAEGSKRPPEQLVVHVAGAVSAPGVVRLSAASRVVDAVTAAGGMRADADPDRVNLAAPLVDGQRVVVPAIGQPPPAEIFPGSPVGAAPGLPAGPVELNSATAEQLDTLPGVGPATAAAIIDHRGSAGPFDSVEDLLDVRGIGEAKLEALRDLVSVGSGR